MHLRSASTRFSHMPICWFQLMIVRLTSPRGESCLSRVVLRRSSFGLRPRFSGSIPTRLTGFAFDALWNNTA